jgi:hypothetical protein
VKTFLNKALGNEQIALVKDGSTDKPTLVRMHRSTSFPTSAERGRTAPAGRDEDHRRGRAGVIVRHQPPMPRASAGRLVRAKASEGMERFAITASGPDPVALGVHDMVLSPTHHTPVASAAMACTIVGERPIRWGLMPGLLIVEAFYDI